MLLEVNEPVEVVAVFKKNMALPAIIKWNNRTYKIKKVDMTHQTFDGDTRMHHFSVSDEANFFKLSFNTKNLKWTLEQLYNEG